MDAFMTSIVLSIQTPFYQTLQTGDVVTLVPTSENTKDPNAVEVYLGLTLVGYVANGKETIVPDTKGAASVHRLVSNKKVAKTTAVLCEESEFSNSLGMKQRRFVAEMFFIPTRANGNEGATGVQARQYTVGGVASQNPNKSVVLRELVKAEETGEPLSFPVNLSRIKAGTIDNITVYLPDCPDAGAGCGIVTNVDHVLESFLGSCDSVSAKAVATGPNNSYVIEVWPPNNSIDEFYGFVDEAVARGVGQATAIEEKVLFMKESRFPSDVIKAVVKQMPTLGRRRTQVPKPKTPYYQKMGTNLIDSVAYLLNAKTLRLVGEKSAGKNTLAETACWLMNRPMCRVQGSSELDKLDLLGSRTFKENSTGFELSDMLETLRHGGIVILDEVNTVRPDVLTVMHSLTDGARSIDVPGYGPVFMDPKSCIVYTMNEGYVGTGDMNQATIDRGPTLIVKPEDNLGALLKRAVPKAKESDIKTCVNVSAGIKKSITESGVLPPDSDSIRGYIDALDTLPVIPLRRALIQNVANKAQSEAERTAITTIIMSMT